MQDNEIVDLYWSRDEDAIRQTDAKYGAYCFRIAYNVLSSKEDSDECVNDTYLKAWNSMPEARPAKLSSFLGCITRNIALSKYRYYSAIRRANGRVECALDEVENYISDIDTPEDIINEMVINDVINDFLKSLSEKNRNIFVERFWFFETISEIAEKNYLSKNSVSIRLSRMKQILRDVLAEESKKV